MKTFLLVFSLLVTLDTAAQGNDPAQIRGLRLAKLRHTAAAQALQGTPAGKVPATDYLQLLYAWYDSDLLPEVQGAAAEDFFVAHQAILRQRATLRQRPAPALAASHDSSTTHLRQLATLLPKVRTLPVPAQLNMVRRLARREQALWQLAQGLAPK